MSELGLPHGGCLVNRVLAGKKKQDILERARSIPSVQLSPRELSDLELIAVGAFSPLRGFLKRTDYLGVLRDMCLEDGALWSLPITLAVTAEEADNLTEGKEVLLTDQGGKIYGVMLLEEKFTYSKEEEALKVYRTTDPAHPGVNTLYQQGEVCLGGEVFLFERLPRVYPTYHLEPADTRQVFRERGWRQVVGFQTRNPVHRAHEYIQKCAMEIVDGLLLHPIVGETKKDDIPAEIRMRSYEELLKNYYPQDRAMLAVLPAAMRYAGPREAVFHALVRKNYGCTHFIVGRDHAGVGNYYGTYDAQLIFEEFSQIALGIIPLFFEHTFYCRKCGNMASSKSCPHDAAEHLVLSGTKVREMLARGEVPPVEFTRPEVAKVLMQ
ncbi:MAG: sulfate adenylyltransferase [Bacillota bacterium]